MKMIKITIVLAVAFLVGCGEEARKYEWVIERGKRNGEEVQRDLNVMAVHEWRCEWDGNLEESGFYIYFFKRMYPHKAKKILEETKKDLESKKSIED